MTAAKTILVVDDDKELRAGLKAVLEEHGYRTLEAEDGRYAKELITGHKPDLVILDMMMPHSGGFAVLEHYHGQADAPPFIMITANDGVKHHVYARQFGVVEYLLKPFSMDRLLLGVEKSLQISAPQAPAAPAKDQGPPLRCQCASCGARIKAPARMLGLTRPCPRCGQPVVVQPQPGEDEGPKLVLDVLDEN